MFFFIFWDVSVSISSIFSFTSFSLLDNSLYLFYPCSFYNLSLLFFLIFFWFFFLTLMMITISCFFMHSFLVSFVISVAIIHLLYIGEKKNLFLISWMIHCFFHVIHGFILTHIPKMNSIITFFKKNNYYNTHTLLH